MWTIFKVFIEFVNNFVSVFCFGLEACGILASQSGVELTPCALEGEMLTTGLPGKSLFSIFSVVYRGGIYRSCSNSILSFLRNLHAIFHSGRTFHIPASKNKTENSCSGTCGKIGTFICTKAPIFPHVPQQLFSTLFFDSSQPNRSEVVSFCSFWFAFPKWLVILNFSRAYWPLVYHLWRTLKKF